MAWHYVILLVLSPTILYGLGLAAAALASTFYRRRCPACGRRSLRYVNFIRAAVVVNGRRAPDHWSYYVCELCGAGFKFHRGQWHRIEAAELALYTADRTEPTVPPERRSSNR